MLVNNNFLEKKPALSYYKLSEISWYNSSPSLAINKIPNESIACEEKNIEVKQPNFSVWFRKKLNERNLTHVEFVTRSGLSKTTVSNLKNQDLTFNKHTLMSVKRAFGIKMPLEHFLAEISAGRDPETSSDVTSHREPEKQAPSFRGWIMVTILFLVIIAASFWLMKENLSPVRIFYRSSDGEHIELHCEDGTKVRIPIGAPITRPFTVKSEEGRLFVTAVRGPHNKITYEPGTVLAFDSTGAEQWKYGLYDRKFLSFSPPHDKASLSGIFEKVFSGSGTFLPGTQVQQIWAYATEVGFAVSRFGLINTKGDPVYSLWSWGRYDSIVIEDIDKDGVDEAIAIVTNNNLGKMVSRIQGKPVNDFYFNCVVYFEPIPNKTECIPGFFYQPDCPSESIKWIAIVPHYKNFVSSVGVEKSENESVVRISSELNLIYYVTPNGQYHDIFVTHEWLRRFKSQHTPALVMLKVTSSEIKKEIIPTCNDGENHFDLVYSEEEIDALMTLLKISMPLKNYVPSYFYDGRLITEIDN